MSISVEEKPMVMSSNPNGISCAIEFIVQNPGSFPCLSGVQEGVGVYKEASSTLIKSKADLVGV
jgi:hypothetical protein